METILLEVTQSEDGVSVTPKLSSLQGAAFQGASGTETLVTPQNTLLERTKAPGGIAATPQVAPAVSSLQQAVSQCTAGGVAAYESTASASTPTIVLEKDSSLSGTFGKGKAIIYSLPTTAMAERQHAAALTICKAWRAYLLLARLQSRLPLVPVLPKKRQRPSKTKRDRYKRQVAAHTIIKAWRAYSMLARSQGRFPRTHSSRLFRHTASLGVEEAWLAFMSPASPLPPKKRTRRGKKQRDRLKKRIAATAVAEVKISPQGTLPFVLQKNKVADFTGNLTISPSLQNETSYVIGNAESMQRMHSTSAPRVGKLTTDTAGNHETQLHIPTPTGFVNQNSQYVARSTSYPVQGMHSASSGNQGQQFQVLAPPGFGEQSSPNLRSTVAAGLPRGYSACGGLDPQTLKRKLWRRRTNQRFQGAGHAGTPVTVVLADRSLNMWHDGFDAADGMVFTHEERLREELMTLLDSADG